MKVVIMLMKYKYINHKKYIMYRIVNELFQLVRIIENLNFQ